jgi:hypothetical protein
MGIDTTDGCDQTTEEVSTTGPTSRRVLFGRGATVIAAAAAAGIAGSERAAADDGQDLIIGQSNTGTDTTNLSGGSTLRVVGGTSSADASVHGVNGGAGDVGVRGDATGTSGRGVFGVATGSGGVGVSGQFTGGAPGSGVVGTSSNGGGVVGRSTLGVGVVGEGTKSDFYANQTGLIGLAPAVVGATAAGGVGTIGRDAAGSLWYCFAPNRWQRIGGPAGAGGFHAIDPVRVFDSRNPGFPNTGPLVAGTNRVISVADGRDGNSGAVTAPNAVPPGASAVTFNVTVVLTTAPSHLSIVPGDVAVTQTSSINWQASGAVVANGTQSKLGGDRLLNLIPGPNGTFHAIIDVNGYYL